MRANERTQKFANSMKIISLIFLRQTALVSAPCVAGWLEDYPNQGKLNLPELGRVCATCTVHPPFKLWAGLGIKSRDRPFA